MPDVKEPSNVTKSKRSGRRFVKLAIYLLVAYLVGFFALGLGYRSENDNVRLATANIYRPLIDLVKDTVPGIRSAVVLRFRIFCVGAEHRCRVTYDQSAALIPTGMLTVSQHCMLILMGFSVTGLTYTAISRWGWFWW
jgi:hypothetical protein